MLKSEVPIENFIQKSLKTILVPILFKRGSQNVDKA